MNPSRPAEVAPELSRVERKRIRRVNEILGVAAEVLAERGYHGTSLEEVADRLDLAKASLYHYFDSKEALISACLGTPAEEIVRRLTPVGRGEGTPTERLRRLIVQQLIFTTQEYPELSRLFLRHLAWPASIEAKMRKWHRRHDAIFKGVIDEGVAAGDFRVADPAVARRCLHGALNSVPFWGVRGNGKRSDGRVIEMVADSVLLMFGVAPAGD